VRIRYEDFLENPHPGVDPCHSLAREQQEDRREALRELEAFEMKWS
jgi:hypothetical protein